MTIYESLKISGRLKTLLKTTVNRLKTHPDCSDIVKLIVDATQSGYVPDSTELDDAENYDKWIELVAYTRVNPDFNSLIFRRISAFLVEFSLTAYRQEVFFSNWLEKCTRLLLVMQEKPRLKSLAAYIGCSFFQGFYKVYCELDLEISQNERIITGISIAREQLNRQVEKLEEDRNHLAELVDIWKIYRPFVLAAIRSKHIAFQIFEKICKIFETCNIIYQESQSFMRIYWDCLQITNFRMKFASLCSLSKIVSNDSASDSNKLTLIKTLVEDTGAVILYNLATHNSIPIREKTLWILIYIHRSNLTMLSWSREQYDTILTNVFNPKKSIRKLSGQLMLLVLHKDSEKDIFCEILDFFIDYSSDPTDLPNLIDAIWNFDFMKKFENLFELLANPANRINNVRNAVVSQFIVAIFKIFLQDENYDEQSILTGLKILPKALEWMQDYPIHYELMLQILLYVDFAMYDPNYIGHHKYIKRLIKSLKYVLLNQTKYKTIQIVMNVFVKLRDAFPNVKLELNETVNFIYQEFKSAHTAWIQQLTSNEIDEENRKDLESSACKMAILLAHEHVFEENTEMDLFHVFRCTIIIDKRFEILSEEFQTIEIFYFESLSNLLTMSIIDLMKSNIRDSNHIEFIKNLVENSIKLLLDKLPQSEQHKINNLFILEKILKILIHMILTVQPGFFFACKGRDELKCLATNLELANYNLIVNTCADAIFENISLGTDNGDLVQDHTSVELKQKIFKNFTRLHRDYNFLPFSNGPWKFFVKMAFNEKFASEIDELLLIISNIKSPFEANGCRISSILSVVLVHFSNDGDTKKIKAILKRWTDLLKINLEESLLAEIFTTTVLSTIQKLKEIVKAVAPNRNRILALNLLKPFIINDSRRCQRILEGTELLDGVLGRDERSTFKEFQNYILNLQ